MKTVVGVPVSPGVAIGRVLLFGASGLRIPQKFITVDAIDKEIARFRAAIAFVAKSLDENQKVARERLGDEYAQIFVAHSMMLQDPKMSGEIEGLIRSKCYSAENAANRVFQNYAKLFQNLGDSYLAERATDVFDLEKRVVEALLGKNHADLAHLHEPVVILAHNLTPSETAGLDRKNVLGFATEIGGRTSHTAILAGALELPAVVGIGAFLDEVTADAMVIIDGDRGEVILDPDDATLAKYRESAALRKTDEDRLAALYSVTATTLDSVRIQVLGNIEFAEEVQHCVERGADGIGLYRTEFLYLGNTKEPSEEDQFNAYCEVVKACKDNPVVIRTLDLGADKFHSQTGKFAGECENPALGLRSIRLSLENTAMFETQLRAILRASVYGDVRIMFPLVTSLIELRRAKMILAEVMDDLAESNIEFKRDIQVGMMVEVPAAALLADRFAAEVDFFSIGTNDLIQYTLAVDRADPSVANLYWAGDPSILRLIRMVVEAGKAHGIPVNACGQMSSEARFIPLLIGLGLRHLSVTPSSIPEVKDLIRHLTASQAEEIARHALTMDLARDVENYLKGELDRLLRGGTLSD